ncbi:HNH endonuclease [Mesorhizobium sp. B3-1-6]|uniref:HNH endonuclease n=1 Tax=Mesorhizobium sp. B3-1-6 TaxID=2589895 RepID=UPI00112AF187|nr:HNH endonuclease [Mesorhizobium sp. B3-1-6]TPI25113.1 HNH endonuclease [Mesorhizobium sp. B3-1-6]
MLLDPVTLAGRISGEAGLQLSSEGGADEDRHQWIALRPAEHDPAHTFEIRISILWRRLKIEFLPGKFARPLLAEMAKADEDGRAAFSSIVRDLALRGASFEWQVDGVSIPFDAPDIWGRDWSRMRLQLNRGNLELGIDEGRSDFEIVSEWTQRFVAAIVALLPLEAVQTESNELPLGFPEGAAAPMLVNRYERDRRNRAAALAIHGTRCKACGVDFGERYGPIAAGVIDIHHTIPLSRLGEDYVIDPFNDLVPLCPNCHRVAHRTDPPLKVEAITAIMQQRFGAPPNAAG